MVPSLHELQCVHVLKAVAVLGGVTIVSPLLLTLAGLHRPLLLIKISGLTLEPMSLCVGPAPAQPAARPTSQPRKSRSRGQASISRQGSRVTFFWTRLAGYLIATGLSDHQPGCTWDTHR